MASVAPGLIRRRALFGVLVLGLPSVAVSLVLLLFSDYLCSPPSHGADSFSRSAIGYHGLPTLLRSWGYGVLQSRCNTAERASGGDLVILAEPSTAHEYAVPVKIAALAQARGSTVLLILPKWEGDPHELVIGWVGRARAVPPSRIDALMDMCEFLGEPAVGRAEGGTPDSWEAAGGLPAAVTLPSPQLIRADGIGGEFLVRSAEGGLIARNAAGTMYVVSDPDLCNNAGLARGWNAAVLHALVAKVIKPRSVIIDETTHGFYRSDSFWLAAVSYPLALFTGALGLLAALALWRGFRRFGKAEKAPPRLAPGKAGLLENTAELLVAGGHTDAALQAYLALALQLAGRSLGTGPDGERLGALSRVRGLAHDPAALAREIKDFGRHRWPAALAHAAAIHAWRAELCREGAHRHAT